METPPVERPAADNAFDRVVKWGVAAIFSGFVAWMLLPGLAGPRDAPRRTECRNHLKQLALAMHNYHDTYGSFPPAYIADKDGRPMHSWRVLLLPFLELRPLYEQYRFDEPWNGPHNRDLAALPIPLFHCALDTGPATDANYFVVVGPKTVFPGAVPIAIKDIADGTSNTILLVEVAGSGINWLAPRDLSYEEAVRGLNPKSGLGISSHHKEGANVAFADGSTQFLPDETPRERLRLLLERNDGQPVPYFDGR
jgi:prepilin-type processing-associated H-X9-DG protein